MAKSNEITSTEPSKNDMPVLTAIKTPAARNNLSEKMALNFLTTGFSAAELNGAALIGSSV